MGTGIPLANESRPRVLVIEDESEVGRFIVRALTAANVEPAPMEFLAGDHELVARQRRRSLHNNRTTTDVAQFDAELVHDRESALAKLESDTYDIYFLDLKLVPTNSPEDSKAAVEQGRELISIIRRMSKSVGIIVLSGEPARPNSVPALGEGANIYLEKPLSAEDIRTAALSLWRRIENQRPRGRIKVGDWWFTVGNRAMINQRGGGVRLSPSEYAFLEHLILAERHEVDRVSFAERVLGGEFGDKDRRMDNIKKRLTKKLGETVQIIQIRDRGYKLVGAA